MPQQIANQMRKLIDQIESDRIAKNITRRTMTNNAGVSSEVYRRTHKGYHIPKMSVVISYARTVGMRVMLNSLSLRTSMDAVECIEQERINKGCTTSLLFSCATMSDTNWSKMRKGITEPKIEKILRLCNALDINVSLLRIENNQLTNG